MEEELTVNYVTIVLEELIAQPGNCIREDIHKEIRH